jgi:hypothetical protein
VPDGLFTYSVKNPLIIISINSEIWAGDHFKLVTDFGQLIKVILREGVGKGVVGGKVV